MEKSESIFNRSTSVLLLSQLFLLAGYGAFITTYAPLTTTTLGWSTLEVGIAFSVFGLGSIVLGPWLSHLADLYGRRGIAILSCIPLALFADVLVFAFPRAIIYPVTFLAGAGLTAFTAAWFALLYEAAPDARRGRTFGIVNALSQLGIVVGATIASTAWQNIDIGIAMLTEALRCCWRRWC
jgi:MFS family permease